MTVCEFCLSGDSESQLLSISPSEMEKRSRGRIRVNRGVVSCSSCLTDLLAVSKTFSKWQNRVSLSTVGGVKESVDRTGEALAIIRNEPDDLPSSPALDDSMSREPQESRFTCPHCYVAPFGDDKSLSTHEMLNHRCFRCSSIFPNKHRLQSHSKQCMREMQIRCPACHLRFESDSRLSSHISEAHDGLENSVACMRCDAVFVSEASLRAHGHVHNWSDSFVQASEKPIAKKLRGEKEADAESGVPVLKTYLRKDS